MEDTTGTRVEHSSAAPGVVSEWTQVLADTDPVDLSEAQLIDLLRELEELKCAAEGAQAAATARFDESVRAAAAARGVPAAQQGRGVAQQVALARRCSPAKAQRLVGLAKILPTELPCTYAALRAGKVNEWRATVMARETIHSDLPDRRRVDTELAGDPELFEQMGEREVAVKARARADELDPVAAVKRRRNAEADRHVSLRPAPDTMTWLGGLLPVKDGVACKVALDQAADAARAAGDDRSRGQVMADELVARVTGSGGGLDKLDQQEAGLDKPDQQATSADRAAREGSQVVEPDEPLGEEESRPRHPKVTINLTVSDHTLFGDSDDTAYLDGYGPIPAELAREIVKSAAEAGLADLRRLYVNTDGRITAMDSRTRCFTSNLATLIRLRDRTCRTPYCDAPIRHLDHVQDAAAGGATSYDNGQGLCEACNHAKQASGWKLTRIGHHIEITTPTGHRHSSRDPDPPTPAQATRYPIDLIWAPARR